MENIKLEKLPEKELKATIKKIKQKVPKNLDETFQDWHDEVFEKIDCLECQIDIRIIFSILYA
jgi:hypothetical protein